jgi:predicted cupin superfamily sugar epimerase
MPDRREFLAGAALASAASLTSTHASAQGSAMHQGMTYDEVKKLLNLEPNATCGYVRVTFVSDKKIAPGGLPAPFADGRPAGSALFFMLTPEEPVKLHRIRNDQFYHYYLGDPIEVLMMLTDGSTQQHIVGPDLRAGHKVQLFIPGNTFHTARVIGTRQWFLGGSTEWPGVEPADVELGKVEELAAKYPSVADKIRTWPLPAK